MDETKSIDENVDEFMKLVADLENLEINIEDEDQAIFLLNSLPKQYDHLKDTLKYGKEALTLEEVLSAVFSKELDLKASGKLSKSNGECLNVRGRPDKRGSSDKNRGKSRSKSKGRRTCWHCHKEGHLRRNCPARKKESGKSEDSGILDSVNLSNGFDTADVLSVSSDDPKDQWILDSGCSFHMTPRKDWLLNYSDLEGGKC